jgi:hypothetical protein
MVTMNLKLLANGQLPNVKGTLYTCPALTTVIIKTVSYVNTGAALSVNLYVTKAAGTSRRVIPNNMTLGTDFSMLYDDEITLEAGDYIDGDATNATQVDYTINGVEKV